MQFLSERRRSLTLNVLYHGSCMKIDHLTPQPSMRTSKLVEWKDEAVFATPDYRIALHYTANKLDETSGISTGIDLRTPIDSNEPVIFCIIGGDSVEECLDLLYGNLSDPSSCKGYIYHLDGSKYEREVGLGANEKVSRTTDSVIFRQEVNRRELIDEYIKKGSIQIVFIGNSPSPENNGPRIS